MERNVLTWNQALKRACEPKDYSYKLIDISKGRYIVKIGFKICAKKTTPDSCYLPLQK